MDSTFLHFTDRTYRLGQEIMEAAYSLNGPIRVKHETILGLHDYEFQFELSRELCRDLTKISFTANWEGSCLSR